MENIEQIVKCVGELTAAIIALTSAIVGLCSILTKMIPVLRKGHWALPAVKLMGRIALNHPPIGDDMRPVSKKSKGGKHE